MNDLLALYLPQTIHSAKRRTRQHLECIQRTIERALNDMDCDRIPGAFVSSIPNDLSWALQAVMEWEALVEVAKLADDPKDSE